MTALFAPMSSNFFEHALRLRARARGEGVRFAGQKRVFGHVGGNDVGVGAEGAPLFRHFFGHAAVKAAVVAHHRIEHLDGGFLLLEKIGDDLHLPGLPR